MVLSTDTRPPCISTRALTMAEPRPVPRALRVLAPSSFAGNLWKSSPIFSGGMPLPRSVTEESHEAVAGPLRGECHFRLGAAPPSVALDSKFTIT